MAVTIINYLPSRLSLPEPVGDLNPRERKFFPYIEYDKIINDPRFILPKVENKIDIIGGDPGNLPIYDSLWSGPSRFKLGNFHFWVDVTGALRMKNGNAAGDLDGVVIGPGGGMVNHGASHVFNGTDPIPNIETLEDLWTCPVGVAVRDVVYETSANNCDQANANTIATMPVIGVVMSKPTPTSCVVARSGEVAGFGVLTADQPYFAGTIAGTITGSAPAGTRRVVQPIGYARNADVLVVELGPYTVRA